ncbi:hypothetical protein ROBYS_42540 [Roseobacter sp. OBYS 0001]|nr:hypothetical protein ROBYS_42540 [Roseobacter sp. OBYS 0001]
MRSTAKLLGIEITVPDFSTLSRRGGELPMPRQPISRSDKPIHLTVDSTGLAHESPCSAGVSPNVQSKIDKLATLIDGSPKKIPTPI